MRILIDTNVLIRFTESAHVGHSMARSVLAGIVERGHQPCLVPQIIYEFWVVGTRPMENNGLAMSVQDVRNAIDDAKDFFRLLRDERGLFERWEQLVGEYEVRGKAAHDARLVAAMQRHANSHLLTFNAPDFERYVGITVINPAEAARLPSAD